ncbi:MAG: hypothetical protein AAF236_13225, partial [Verrucomicrobiota bacterium]
MKKLILSLSFAVSLGTVGLILAQNEEAAAEGQVLSTKTYVVPPTFLSRDVAGGESSSPSDPFSDPVDDGRSVTRRATSKETLESAGISFSEEGSVIYNPTTSQLIVRTTKDQHELIEAYLDSIVESSEKQIQIIVEMIEVEHLDFSDWLLSNSFDHNGTELRRQ